LFRVSLGTAGFASVLRTLTGSLGGISTRRALLAPA
jgi:hypothetical protein